MVLTAYQLHILFDIINFMKPNNCLECLSRLENLPEDVAALTQLQTKKEINCTKPCELPGMLRNATERTGLPATSNLSTRRRGETSQ